MNVTGTTAQTVDCSDQLSRAMPIVFGFVLVMAFILLLVTFRSIVIPIKAIVLNLLSVGAAYGVLTLVFQDGHGEACWASSPPAESSRWLPLFLFVVLFGLSMDYHVFILSRVREAVDRGMRTEDAVSYGIKSTAGVVTSAAFVMVAVFCDLRDAERHRLQGDGRRPRGRGPDRRDDRARGAAAGHDEAAGRAELVPAAASSLAAQGPRRGGSGARGAER